MFKAINFVLFGVLAISFVACKPDINSDVKIVNGKQISDDTLDHIVQISIPDPNSSGSSFGCTATWVGPNTIFTAAHCVEENNRLLNNVSVSRGFKKGAKAIKVLAHPKALNAGNVIHPGYRDFAILVFPENTSSKYIAVTESLPKTGSSMEIVGFGKYNHLDGSSGGPKRIGKNVLTSFDANYGTLEFKGKISPINGDGSNAINSQGDSGGPLLVAGRLAGVSSSIGAERGSNGAMLPVQEGNYVAVSDPSVRKFIEDSIKQHNLKIAGINIEPTVKGSDYAVGSSNSNDTSNQKPIAVKVLKQNSNLTMFVGVASNISQVRVVALSGGKTFTAEKVPVSGTRSIFKVNLAQGLELKQGIAIESLDSQNKVIHSRKIRSNS